MTESRITGRFLDKAIRRVKSDEPDPSPHPVMYVTVEKVAEKFQTLWDAEKKNLVDVSLGWFVHFHGSFESLRWGDKQPSDIKPGDRYRIVFEKIDGAAA